jgi:excisionase family DNA binding protein
MSSLTARQTSSALKIQTPSSELTSISSLYAVLATELQKNSRLIVVSQQNGAQVEIPAFLAGPLLQIVEMLNQGATVNVVAEETLLSTEEAAALLGVSRQYLVRVLDAGQLPCVRTGTHRRVRAADVLEFKQHRDRTRQALKDLTRLSQEVGGYGEMNRTNE